MFLCMQKIRMIPLLRPKKVVECVSEYISFIKKNKTKTKVKTRRQKAKENKEEKRISVQKLRGDNVVC